MQAYITKNSISWKLCLLRSIFAVAVVLTSPISTARGQGKPDDNKLIKELVKTYSQAVISRDSLMFYRLFNDGLVIWCSKLSSYSLQQSLKDHKSFRTNDAYNTGSYQGFMRSLFKYTSTEDKFDRIRITGDGTVASVIMDYSFWANGRMTNWGSKLLTLIKRSDGWKITSVSYSIELVEYRAQPSLETRENSLVDL